MGHISPQNQNEKNTKTNLHKENEIDRKVVFIV